VPRCVINPSPNFGARCRSVAGLGQSARSAVPHPDDCYERRPRAVADGARGPCRSVLAWADTPPGCHGVTLNDALIMTEGRAGTLVCRGAAMAPEEGKTMSWFWLNIPLMVVFFGCWAGIPLWHTLTRWDAELRAKHAEIAATAVAELVFAQPAPATAAAHRAGRLAYAGVADPRGR